MRLLFTLSCFLLMGASTLAQSTLFGRVTDRATGRGLPGVTVVLKGTDKGISTTADGTFSLQLARADTSFVLVFSAINYMPVERLARSNDSVQVALSQGTVCYSYPDAQLELVSGLLHTPFGGRLQVYGSRFVHLPLRATLGYQTNFRRNSQQQFHLEWLDWYVRRASLTLGLRRQAVYNGRQELSFASHSLTVETDFYRYLPVLLLSTGRARFIDEHGPRTGYGYEGGARHYFQRPRLTVQATATRWPDYWQYQGEISRYFQRVEIGVRLFSLPHYREISLRAGLNVN